MTPEPSVTPWAPPEGGVRVARALGSSVVVTAAAAAAHLTSGGRADGVVVFALVAVLAPICWLLAAQRLGTARLAGLLILAQAVVHLACSSSDASAGLPMLVGHVVASVLSLAVLTWGERALLGLVDRIVARWSVPRVHVLDPTTTTAAVRTAAVVSRVRVLVLGERAPPVAA